MLKKSARKLKKKIELAVACVLPGNVIGSTYNVNGMYVTQVWGSSTFFNIETGNVAFELAKRELRDLNLVDGRWWVKSQDNKRFLDYETGKTTFSSPSGRELCDTISFADGRFFVKEYRGPVRRYRGEKEIFYDVKERRIAFEFPERLAGSNITQVDDMLLCLAIDWATFYDLRTGKPVFKFKRTVSPDMSMVEDRHVVLDWKEQQTFYDLKSGKVAFRLDQKVERLRPICDTGEKYLVLGDDRRTVYFFPVPAGTITARRVEGAAQAFQAKLEDLVVEYQKRFPGINPDVLEQLKKDVYAAYLNATQPL